MTDAAGPALRKNRRTLLLMVGSLLFVIIAATVLHRLADSGDGDLPALLGTSNRGTLVDPPLAMADLQLRTELAGAQDYASLPPKWTVLVAVSGECDEICRSSLYLTRQVRVALGRDQPRVRRILLTDVEVIERGFREWLRQEHDDLLVLHASTETVAQVQSRVPGIARPAYSVIDPQGWLMMTYRQQQDPKDLMADLKFLLKYSNE